MNAGLLVDLSSPVPPYEQIRTQIASLIAVGALNPGSKLPTVRSLAADLGVATGTVGRAYKELEAQNLIESRRRAGTVVASQVLEDPLNAIDPELKAEILASIERLVVQSLDAGLSSGFTVQLLQNQFHRLG